jgi:2-deoxy-D-gluconate 3-dehydrogenase
MHNVSNGKFALVTGAGSGIGYASAAMLALEGYRLFCTDQPGRIQLQQRLVASITERGGQAQALEMDVSSYESVVRGFDVVFDEVGVLDVLVNNAGMQLMKPATEVTEEEFDKVVAVNLKGPFLCSQQAHSLMTRGGAIINLASQHGVVANRNRAPYCSSKAGLINLTRALALEWVERGIRVNAVSPTFVRTEENSALLDGIEIAPQIRHDLPLGRAVTPEEVANAVVFLASDRASAITGHNLMVDGGWTAR